VIVVALFRHRRGPKPRVERFYGDEQVPALLGELSRGEWRGTQDALEAAEPMDRAMLTQLLAESFPAELSLLDTWARACPGSAAALTLRGAVHVVSGWQARGDGAGDTVTERGASVFYDHLERAEHDLGHAVDVDPTDPTPWAVSLISARGLELGVDALEKRWNEVSRRAALHRYAANHMIQGMAEKWGGSHELMFDFARRVSAEAPEGHPVHTVVAEAHIERWLRYHMLGDPEGADAYVRQGAVRAELRESARRSVASPSWSDHRWHVMDRNVFAMAFSLAEDPLAGAEFEALGPAVADHPWAYLGNPVRAFAAARARLCA
jgi:hypothetical protein